MWHPSYSCRFDKTPPIVPVWTRSIKSTLSHQLSLKSILILSSHISLCLPSGLFLSGFPMRTPYAPLLSHVCATCLAHLVVHYFITWAKFGSNKNVNPWHACKRTDGRRRYSTSPVLDGVDGQYLRHDHFTAREIPSRHYTGGWVTLGDVLNAHEKFCFHQDSIPGHPSRSESLYRLR